VTAVIGGISALSALVGAPTGAECARDSLSFSIVTEFIENADPHASKQGCAFKAFTRLAERLHRDFPPIAFCGSV